MRGKIFRMDVHCHKNNDHVCDFCDDPSQGVVGCIQVDTLASRTTLLHYCGRCALIQAEKMVEVVHPNYEVRKLES